MAAPRGGTRERILDAAEKLFAARGYEGTSTRAIVTASGDTIGSVNYHFGSKEKLFREVIRRRFDAVADARRSRYCKAEAKAGPQGPTLEAVIDAIVTPYLERALCGDKGWRSYIQLMGSLLASPKIYQKAMAGLGLQVAQEFMGWMARALPDADQGDIAFAYEFMIGCIIECGVEPIIDRVAGFTNGRLSSGDFDAVTPRLVRFITAGVTAVAATKVKQKR
jgi:AcrR family transcriptional regulator